MTSVAHDKKTHNVLNTMQHNSDGLISLTRCPSWPDVREEVAMKRHAVQLEKLVVRCFIHRLDVATAAIRWPLVHLEVNERRLTKASQLQALDDVFGFELCRNVPDPKQRTKLIAVKASGHTGNNDERQKHATTQNSSGCMHIYTITTHSAWEHMKIHTTITHSAWDTYTFKQ